MDSSGENPTQICSSENQVTEHLEKLELNHSVPITTETLISKKPYLLKSLPEKYGLLVKFFNRLDFSIKVLKLGNSVPTFTKIKNLVDHLTKKKFTYTHLAELKYIFPYGIEIEKDVDIPSTTVVIDQDTITDATIVKVSFGGPLPHLIDTMKAVKDLGLDVVKRTITFEGLVLKTEFSVTQLSSGRKVEDLDLVENIRLTIISNLLKYYTECSTRAVAFGIQAPLKKATLLDVATRLLIKDDGPKRSLLCIETEDRPGLLLQIFKIMADDNITVESAEINTNGLVGKNKLHVSYNGAALNDSMTQVLMTCLRYYLDKSEIGGSNSSSTCS